MWKTRALAFVILVAGLGIGYFVYTTQVHSGSPFAFKYGLDVSGGTHLVYSADTSTLAQADIPDAMNTLRDVIERRVNIFGVSEPLVQVETSSVFASAHEERLIVELPGVTDVNQAIALIGQTPLLEFKLVKSGFESTIVNADGSLNQDAFTATGLTGRYLKTARLEFSNSVSQGFANTAYVSLQFDSEGADLFASITKANVGRELAIFLDGALIEAPVIQSEISGGQAVISGGNMTPENAKTLASNLSFGALPVPISLVSTQTIGASLGQQALDAGVFAGIIGLLAVALFMLLWYRLPGFVAVVALGMYVALMLALFKLIPVVLTAAGIAGFILSIGLAVDANILIFERMKEELRGGKTVEEAMHRGFSRAWTSIRDANIAHLISAVILFWFGTALIKGFALTFGLGVFISLFSAITVSRTFLFALSRKKTGRFGIFLLKSGIH